jgi:UDP-2,4-diacetamido-2,4,6-trideoxy-beta-L-altropyranose hydrolase
MKRSVLFRVDGGNIYSIAMGHLYRCLRIAGTLVKKDIRCYFIMKNYPEGIALVNSAGFEVEAIDPDISDIADGEKVISLAMKLGAILFVDLRTTKKALIDLANLKNILTVVYEDVHDEEIVPSILINPSPLILESGVYEGISGKTRILLGMNYIVLDPSVGNHVRKTVSNEIRNVFVCFGGADPCNLSCRVARLLLERNDRFKILLVVGPGFGYAEELMSITRNNDALSRLEIIKNCSELAPIHSKCDAAMTAGGTMVYESIALRVPTFALPSIEYEAALVSLLKKKSLITGIEENVEHIDDHVIRNEIDHFIAANSLRISQFENQKAIDLTGGTKRVVREIFQLAGGYN